MADYKIVDADQLDAGLKVVADAIREKGGTSEKLEFPNGMADAVMGIQSGGSGVSVPHLLSLTEYTHAEDWLGATLGNPVNFANTYCNYGDTTDRKLYVCYIENNEATNQRADYFMLQRVNNGFVSVNYRDTTNYTTTILSSRGFQITSGSKVIVMVFDVGV